MQVDTARMLLDSIATALNLASDNQCKLVALEKLLKDQNPELFEAYTKNLETLRGTLQLRYRLQGSQT